MKTNYSKHIAVALMLMAGVTLLFSATSLHAGAPAPPSGNQTAYAVFENNAGSVGTQIGSNSQPVTVESDQDLFVCIQQDFSAQLVKHHMIGQWRSWGGSWQSMAAIGAGSSTAWEYWNSSYTDHAEDAVPDHFGDTAQGNYIFESDFVGYGGNYPPGGTGKHETWFVIQAPTDSDQYEIRWYDSEEPLALGVIAQVNITVKGQSALGEGTQVVDQLGQTGGTQPSNVELVGFKITPTGENLTWTHLTVNLTYGGTMEDADITNAEIYEDIGIKGTYEQGTDIQVGSQSVNATDTPGALTWNNTVGGTVLGATDYLIIFDAGASLSVDETVQATVTAAGISVTGASSNASIDTSGGPINGPTHTVTSLYTLADHSAGQESDALGGNITEAWLEAFAFQLTNATGAPKTLDDVTFQLSSVNGMVAADFNNFYLYVDDGSGDLAIDEAQDADRLCGETAGIPSISGDTGTISFSACSLGISDGTTVKMILAGELENLAPGDSFTIGLGQNNLSPVADGSDCTSTTHELDGATAYRFRKKITIDKDQLGSCDAPLTDFPLLVTVTGSHFAQVAAASAAGHDIIFKDADGNRLDHEIEVYDETADPGLIAWVSVPIVYYDRDTVIWMYYGNNSVTSATENPDGVWDINFKGVWHLNDGYSTDEYFYKDSTDNNEHGTLTDANTTSAAVDTGQIGGAMDINGDADYIEIVDFSTHLTDQMTISGWVQPQSIAPEGFDGYFGIRNAATKNEFYVLQQVSNHKLECRFRNSAGDGWDASLESPDDEFDDETYQNTWIHVALTYDGDTIRSYLNGVQTPDDATSLAATGSFDSTAFPFRIGAADGHLLNGLVDEVRASSTARTACWIETEYKSQCQPGVDPGCTTSLIDIGSQENLNYNYRKKITIEKDILIDDASCSGDLENFPFLVTLTGDDFTQIDDVVNADGDNNDIIFKDANGYRLDHEIEEYDNTTDYRLNAWVRIPTLYHDRNTVIYLYYGNPGVDTSTENPAGVWDANFKAVWHLGDDFLDSTSNSNDGTNSGSTDDAAKIADGQDFDGADDYVDVGFDASVDNFFAGGATIEAWIRPDTWGENGVGRIVDKGNSYGWAFEVSDNVGADDSLRFLHIRDGNDGRWNTPDFSITLGDWHLVVLTYDEESPANDPTMYIDGQSQVLTEPSGAPTGTAQSDAGPIYLGNIAGSTTQTFEGLIDEVRLSNKIRNACWIKAAYNNQCVPGVDTNCPGTASFTVGSPEGLNYQYRKKITVNAAQIDQVKCSADIPDFPLLVTLTGTDFTDIEDDLGDNAYALNFIANNDAVCGGAGTAPCVLDHEIEAYDATNGLVAWVRIPSLDYDGDTTIYLHYGNPNITESTENAAGVWDDNFVGVWHLEEDGDDIPPVIDGQSTGTHDDSTGTTDGTQNNNGPIAGRIAGGQYFEQSGDPDVIAIHNAGDDINTAQGSVSAWIKMDTMTGWGFVFSARRGDGDQDNRIDLRWEGAANEGAGVFDLKYEANNIDHKISTTAATDSDGLEHFVTLTWDNNEDEVKGYVDGAEVGTDTTAMEDFQGEIAQVRIGASWNDGQGFIGMIDEVRISTEARDACWIDTEYSNQKENSLLVSAGPEESWTFAQYKTITIDNTSLGATCITDETDLLDFPLMIKIDGTDFDDIANDVDDEYEIIFRDENGSKLAHEIEKYEEPNELIAWVKVPRLSATTDTVITIHYGNDDIDTPTENPEGVWDANFQGVWHLKESGDGSYDDFQDSTSNDNHGRGWGGIALQTPTQTSSGKIGNSQSFNGGNFIEMQRDGSAYYYGVLGSGSRTVSAWIKTSESSNQGIFSNGSTLGADWQLLLSTDQSYKLQVLQGSDAIQGTTASLNDGYWHYVAATLYEDGSPSMQDIKLYVDGADDSGSGSSAPIVTIVEEGVPVKIGANGDNGDKWNGIIDEVRISDTERSACWIETEYNNQCEPGVDSNCTNAIYSVGSELDVGAPTAVDLVSFTATGAAAAVDVAWETARESGNQGFHLYRAAGPAGPFSRLTGGMIARQVSSISEKAYDYKDSKVVRGELYYYLLEDIDTAGIRTDHGPVCVDWDGDGLPDDWEIAHGLDTTVNDAGLDADNDGLSNLQEYLRATDPHNPDSDGDGVADGVDDGRIAREDTEQIKSIDRGVYVVAQDDDGITIELRTEFLDSSVVKAGGQKFDRLHIGDYVHGTTETVGAPEMPLKGVLVDIPFDSAADLAIVETEIETRSGYRVYPVPANVGDESGERVAEVFAFDEKAYAEDGFYPEAAARLGDTFVFRDQARQQVVFHPVAYNPATGQIVVYRRIRVRINYGDGPLARVDRIQPMLWQLPAAKTSGPETAFGLLAAVSGPSPLLNSLIFSPILSIGLFNAALWGVPESAPPAVAAYKILVPTAGIYQLSCADLDAAGVDVADGYLSDLRLYHLGEEVAVEVVDANGAVCDANDYIRFYAPAVADAYAKYAADNVFWLTTGTAAGSPLRMETIAAVPDAGAAAVSHDVVVHAEDDEDYWKEIPGADSLDRWYSLSFVEATEETPVGSPVPFDISVPGPAAAGSLTVMMVSTSDKDHEVDVEVVGDGGSIVTETFTWSGLSPYEATIDTVAFDATDAAHSVRITCKSGADFILVDWIEAAYARNFAAAGGQLQFAHAPGYIFTAAGFGSNNLIAYDVTDSTAVGRVNTTAPAGNTFTFEPPADPGQAHTYLALDTAGLRTAADVQIVADSASSLYDTANAADYILITHGRLGWNGSGDEYPWLTAHAAHRRDQGLRVAVVDTADIFDEFSYGMVTPAAIRDFLAYAYENWTAPAPQYVLIVGDASFDPKGNYEAVYGGAAADDTPYVPSYLVHTDYQGETVTDEYFARISGGDAVPDLYIGRLPAADFNEATVMTAKIRAYEEAANAKDWEKNVLLVADNQEPGEDHAYEAVFKQINDDAAALLPATMAPAYGYLGLDFATAAALKNYIKLKLNDDAGLAPETGGALIVNYSGHASMQRWAGENIFENADVADLTNTGMLPFVVSMSCLAGNFSWPEWLAYPALGEELMRAGTLTEGKGAVAALVPSGQTTTAGQRILNTALFDTIFTSDIRRLGPAIAAAKQTLLANGDVYFEQVSETFLLLGDPATVLKVPLPRRPEGLEAASDLDTISLDWQAATDAEGNAVDGYNLYRSPAPAGSYAKVNTGLITATSYEDGDANLPAAPTPFYYTVSAVDGDGDESPRSAVVSAVLKAPTASLGGGGGGGAAPAACFVRTAAESATTGFPWFWVVPALFLGVARAEDEKIRK